MGRGSQRFLPQSWEGVRSALVLDHDAVRRRTMAETQLALVLLEERLPVKNRERWHPTKFVYKRGRLIASRDVREVSPGSRLFVDAVARFYDVNLRRHARGRLLDLGCGKVPLYIAYKDHVTDNVCVDWAGSLHGSEHLDFECDLTAPLPFADAEFDTILLSDVLEHIPRPEDLWKEIVRLLAPGGKLIMNVPFLYWLHEEPHDFYRYTEFALRRFVDLSGMRLVQLEPLGGALEVMTDIFSKNALRLPRIGKTVAIVAQGLASAFIRTSFGKRVSGATAESCPTGYSLVAEKLDHRPLATTRLQGLPGAGANRS
jgi:SAM-dependent methyltransferase